jgi:hypothetical protein
MVQGSCWFVERDWVYYQCIKGTSYKLLRFEKARQVGGDLHF